ncbi:class I SAM-dependent methyltransferase [Streptomyces albiaxialis]|uniref:Class I SAM-dependent methyltransferase n=1 Tax=Streptomyces albiaxialis TaxID=329523 RepID=A0ABP5H622_9ACTN
MAALRDTFDEAAELYDRVRPRYPAALVEELAGHVAPSPGARVLEIGPGTGQLTVPLAELGCRITAVELGPHLAAVARRNLAPHPRARVEVAAFEDWPLPEGGFDAAVAATSFHWLDPEVRVRKLAEALPPGGVLALIATHHVAGGSADFFAEVQRCYERHVPGTGPGQVLPDEAEVSTDTAELRRDGLFGEASTHRYAQEIGYSRAEYLDVLRTYSGHRALPDGTRRALLEAIGALIDERHGGRVTKRYLHELIVTIRQGCFGSAVPGTA